MKTTYNYSTNKNEVWYSGEEIKPFLDPYFDGLDFKTIAELAKKSIRITAYNRELEDKIELINEKIDAVIENCKMLQGENLHCDCVYIQSVFLQAR